MSNGTMKVENGKFRGEISTMMIHLRFQLEPHQANSDKSPTHKIMAKAPAGHTFQAGVAWERTINKGNSAGKTMFTLQLEDPAFGPNPVYLAAFPDGNFGDYSITLERRRQNEAPPANNEEIPFAA